MYLPFGSSTLQVLRFLQLPLLSDPEQSDQLAKPDVCSKLNNLGTLTPYHDAPPFPGVHADLPDDCTVSQVVLLHRHGSRGPSGEQYLIRQLVDTLDRGRDAIQHADLPPYLEFLKEGYKYDVDPEELTIVGRQQLFNHGVEFALHRYPTFYTNEVVSTTVTRVIDSAHFFSQGFFGRDADKIKYLTTANFSDPVTWLTPWESCPELLNPELFQPAQEWVGRYLPPITDKLNKLVPGVGFTVNDTHGALYACPYDLAAREKSPWCDVFTALELGDLEYELDLLFDILTGHISRGDPGPLAGAFYIKKLIERLTDTTENAKSLYLDFAHDITILLALSAMGLNKDAEPLGPLVNYPPPHRKFRTSYQAPFAANMVWEKFTCEQSFQGPQVRLVLNGETFPLSICEKSLKDKDYGTCSLEAFLEANRFSMNVEYHSKVWNVTCGQ